MWLLRAASWLEEHKKDEDDHKKLIEYYQVQRDDYFDKIARYLLDLGSAQEVIDMAGDELDKLCEFSYFFGVKNEMEGNIAEASDWYHISFNTGLEKEGEHRWAYNRLWNWQNAGQL